MKKYKINVMKWNLEKYNSTPLFYQKFQILLLMENANTHLVSIFKDYLLYDDMTEFFKEYYNSKEIYPRLKTIYDYYESSSYLFPNYTAINEGKYIYRNIIKKQKLIDYLEDLEDKKKEKEEKRNLKNKKKYQNQNEQSSSSFIEVFDTKIYDNIRKETWNDSKINDLFCVENKNSNDCDSFASLIKLTEMIKDKEKEKEKINDKKYVKKNIIIDKDNNDKIKLNKNSECNNINNTNNKNSNVNDITKKEINKINNNIIINKDNYSKNAQTGLDNKIYVSRRVNIKQNINTKLYQKRPETNININDFINNNYSTNTNIYTNKNISINFNTNINTNNKSVTHNWSNRNKIINTEPSKSNDFAKKSNGKLIQKNQVNSSNKNTYKKNNIIINIINNNKNNNYNTNNNYFSNYTNNNANTNENNTKNNNYNNFQINNNYFPNYTNINEKIHINNDNLSNINNLNNISNNNSTKNNQNIKININTNYLNNNNNKIKGQISSKGLTVKNTINNNNTSNNKSIINRSKNALKSKLLSFRLATDILSTETNLIRNLTERIRRQSQSNSKKKAKEQQKTKNVFSPKKNMKKRTKSEITGTKSDIFLFGQQNEINTYNKSINRQILKNINLTNVNKQKKEISLINKKIINSHFNINNNSKNKIKNKYIKHSSTNSQNLTSIGIINKIIPLQFKDLSKKKGAVFSVNKTERSSRNHSKDKTNKMNKTIIKRNYKESFSPKKSQDLIYNKIHKIQNKNTNIIICSFLKNVNSNQKIKNLKIKRKSNNNNNFKSININSNNKEAYNKINKDKNI
jgi:hypothetical protein